jgi:hypothetical protein
MQKSVEERLAHLEKLAQHDDERWKHLEGDLKGFEMVIDSIGAPICGSFPALLPTIISNLRVYEEGARTYNAHQATISRVRVAREFFEGRLDKSKRGPKRKA